jgi:hypothetical protein
VLGWIEHLDAGWPTAGESDLAPGVVNGILTFEMLEPKKFDVESVGLTVVVDPHQFLLSWVRSD